MIPHWYDSIRKGIHMKVVWNTMIHFLFSCQHAEIYSETFPPQQDCPIYCPLRISKNKTQPHTTVPLSLHFEKDLTEIHCQKDKTQYQTTQKPPCSSLCDLPPQRKNTLLKDREQNRSLESNYYLWDLQSLPILGF